ncbi:MAG: glycoside hydrolase family 65 protein [Firmicutes bacterium]|nr:glycoside hydrolase family 65 protein [Bacillota bacterium]
MDCGRHEWSIVEDEFDPLKAGHRETVCALGNGYLGVRGAPEEGHPASSPATFIAGVFDAAPGGVPELVVAPNWLRMRVVIDGEEFSMASGEVLGFRRTLDMRDGVLERKVRWRGSRGRTVRLTWRRLVSMADVHAAAVSLTIEPEDDDLEVVVDSAIDGRVSNAKAVHLDVIGGGWDGDASYLVARTRASGVVIAEAQIVAVSGGEATVLGRVPQYPSSPAAIARAAGRGADGEAGEAAGSCARPQAVHGGLLQPGAPGAPGAAQVPEVLPGGGILRGGGILPRDSASPGNSALPGGSASSGAASSAGETTAGVSLRIHCRRGEPVTIEKYVGFATSLDSATGGGRAPTTGGGANVAGGAGAAERTAALASGGTALARGVGNSCGPDGAREPEGHALGAGDSGCVAWAAAGAQMPANSCARVPGNGGGSEGKSGDGGAENGDAGDGGEVGIRGDAAAALALALSAARRGAACRFAGLLEEHRRVWHAIWDRCDIVIEGDDFAQKAMRFAVFQMVQAAPRHTDRVSIGARGLSGEGYKGHVFWDTETFVVPFFTFTLPEIARNLLGYRYHTLPAARRNAASKGYRGAMFAWESADTGEETTPPWGDPNPVTGERRRILCGDLEHHITADVAYAVWQYCMATADEEFLLQKGAEILIETGRFWASRASYNSTLQAYEILHVIGPDEYHEDVNNNFYTNAMARWNIRAALATCDYLRARHPSEWARLASATGISHEELAHMADVAARLVCGRASAAPHGSAGAQPAIEQFDGFSDLADVEIPADEATFRPMEAVIGPEALAMSRVVKQPDVLMALYLLEDNIMGDIDDAVEAESRGCGLADRLPRGGGGRRGRGAHRWKDVLRANWDYYEPRTDHGSSLSCAIHSAIASRLGLREKAWRYFVRAARIDLADAMGNAANGVHMATQGGLWQAVVYGFAGVRADMSVPGVRRPEECASGSGPSPAEAAGLAPWAKGAFSVNPRLPGHWRRLSVPLAWRGTRVRMEFSGSCGGEDHG